MKSNITGKPVEFYKLGKEMFDRIKPLSPNKPAIEKRKWVGLTAEEIHDTPGYRETSEMYRFALALESKLKEKNT